MFSKNPKDVPTEKNPKEEEQITPLIPLRDIIVFPYMVVPLFFFF